MWKKREIIFSHEITFSEKKSKVKKKTLSQFVVFLFTFEHVGECDKRYMKTVKNVNACSLTPISRAQNVPF